MIFLALHHEQNDLPFENNFKSHHFIQRNSVEHPTHFKLTDIKKVKDQNGLSDIRIFQNFSLSKSTGEKRDIRKEPGIALNYNVHVFYYAWYGNPTHDGRYLHWNHEYIPHWKKEEAIKYPSGVYVPPDDIGASFYPLLGPYSSADPYIIDQHMQQISSTGIGKVYASLIYVVVQRPNK